MILGLAFLFLVIGLWSSLAPAYEKLRWPRCLRQDSPTIANLCQAEDPPTWAPDDGEVLPPLVPKHVLDVISVGTSALTPPAKNRRGLVQEFHTATPSTPSWLSLS